MWVEVPSLLWVRKVHNPIVYYGGGKEGEEGGKGGVEGREGVRGGKGGVEGREEWREGRE